MSDEIYDAEEEDIEFAQYMEYTAPKDELTLVWNVLVYDGVQQVR